MLRRQDDRASLLIGEVRGGALILVGGAARGVASFSTLGTAGGVAFLLVDGIDVVVGWPLAVVTAMGRGQPRTAVEATTVVGGAPPTTAGLAAVDALPAPPATADMAALDTAPARPATAGMAAVEAVPAPAGMVGVWGGGSLQGTGRILSLVSLVGRGASVRLLRDTRDGVGRLGLRTSSGTA